MIVDTLLAKVIGTQNERDLKRLRPMVAEISAKEPGDRGALRRAASWKDGGVPPAACQRRSARRSAPGSVRGRPRGGPPRAEDAALRRAAHRRHRAAPREDRRDEDRRRQDARRHAARLSQCARRQRRPRRHGQRLPRAPRLRMDGPPLPVPRHVGRGHPARSERSGAPGRLRRRHHLRHEQRVRLRLPPRQHEVRPRALRAARAPLRDRGRGRQHPDRRGADPAHHLRAGGGIDRPLLRGRSHRAEADAGRRDAGQRQGGGSRGAREDRRLPRRREAQDRDADRDRHGEGREDAGPPAAPRRPVRPGEHAAPPPHQPGPEGAHDLQARRRLHDQGRRRRDRRRVHRPPDAGPALERRPPPGGGGEGEGQDRAGEPDARHRHLPELLPQVQEAVPA